MKRLIFVGVPIVLVGCAVAAYFIFLWEPKVDSISVTNVQSENAVPTNTNVNTQVNRSVATNTNISVNTSVVVNANTNVNRNSINVNVNVNAQVTETTTTANVNSNLPEPVGKVDRDGDGILNFIEYYYGSSDEKKDTDGDGHDDLTEIRAGYSPKGAGKLDGTFFTSTFCPGIFQVNICKNYTQETREQMKKLCKPWEAVGTNYCKLQLEKVNIYDPKNTALLEKEEALEKTACDATGKILDDGVQAYLKGININITKNGICGFMTYNSAVMCYIDFILDANKR